MQVVVVGSGGRGGAVAGCHGLWGVTVVAALTAAIWFYGFKAILRW